MSGKNKPTELSSTQSLYRHPEKQCVIWTKPITIYSEIVEVNVSGAPLQLLPSQPKKLENKITSVTNITTESPHSNMQAVKSQFSNTIEKKIYLNYSNSSEMSEKEKSNRVKERILAEWERNYRSRERTPNSSFSSLTAGEEPMMVRSTFVHDFLILSPQPTFLLS